MMRDYPETLKAVILDGASALSVRSWMQDRVINVDVGVEHLVATCEAEAKCAETGVGMSMKERSEHKCDTMAKRGSLAHNVGVVNDFALHRELSGAASLVQPILSGFS